jgi:transcriptional regulator with XRE-family HTH domain
MPGKKRTIRHAAIVQVFAERLRAVRLSRQMTQRELADKAQVTLSYISRLESGGAAPGIDLLERLANALKIHLTELLPALVESQAIEDFREQIRQLFESVLAKSGRETLTMLNMHLIRLAESPATNR